MRLLLDTHVMLWWEMDSPRLSAATREFILSAEAVFFSRASLWEMAIKQSLGRLDIDLEKFVATISAQGFSWLDIAHEHLLEVAKLPWLEDHRDPFDRLLVAQSRSEPLILLTHDKKLMHYGSMVRLCP